MAFPALLPPFIKKNVSVQGQIAGALSPIVARYNALGQKDRALFRRTVRSFVRWYNYLTQITRLFDSETQKEHVFLAYLEHLLPSDSHEILDLEGAVKLKYYKLKETFSGAIELEKKPAVFDSPKPKPATEAYAGEFTDADLVIVEMVLPKVLGNSKLKSAAAANDQKVYVEGIFPGILEKIVVDAYLENDKAFDLLLKDKEKYAAFMKALANISYLEFKKPRASSKGTRQVSAASGIGWGEAVAEEGDGAYLSAAEKDVNDGE